ncbi:hypothetical protein RHA1_ro02693 [Rhodococcus jostii RHA1]|uniref:Uncharacterized protein n=1 Tax=Rhodococcus jostii (strain RHA1) TaxID=101510 RepID=Q0SD88_RHOJR|nr:hypothetical protein RHA1_ro02693 [Rhodococcus jostii RHA1]
MSGRPPNGVGPLFNTDRLHSSIDQFPPNDYDTHYREQPHRRLDPRDRLNEVSNYVRADQSAYRTFRAITAMHTCSVATAE